MARVAFYILARECDHGKNLERRTAEYESLSLRGSNARRGECGTIFTAEIGAI